MSVEKYRTLVSKFREDLDNALESLTVYETVKHRKRPWWSHIIKDSSMDDEKIDDLLMN